MNRAIQCIIVEDEPYAQEILQDYIAMLPDLRLEGIAETPEQMQQLMAADPDLALLDLSVVRRLMAGNLVTWPADQVRPLTIITTAYHRYDLADVPFRVVQFLRKPIRFDQFADAVEQVRRQLNEDRRETDL